MLWRYASLGAGKRLRPLVPILVEAMERHGHLQLAPEVRAGLVTMSAATIDRALCKVKEQASGGPRRARITYGRRGYGCLDGETESLGDLTITLSIQPAKGILEPQ